MQILVVEDDRVSRKLVRHIIETYHVPPLLVRSAITVEEAQHLLVNEGPFCLVLVDWELPDASGVTLVRWMRAVPELHSLPAVMLTGRSTAEDVLEAIESGANDYLIKPLHRQALLDKLHKHIPTRGHAA